MSCPISFVLPNLAKPALPSHAMPNHACRTLPNPRRRGRTPLALSVRLIKMRWSKLLPVATVSVCADRAHGRRAASHRACGETDVSVVKTDDAKAPIGETRAEDLGPRNHLSSKPHNEHNRRCAFVPTSSYAISMPFAATIGISPGSADLAPNGSKHRATSDAEFSLCVAISGENSTYRSHQPTGLILHPLHGKLVEGPGDMDGLALHAGFVSFAGEGHSAVTDTLLPLISSDNASLNAKTYAFDAA